MRTPIYIVGPVLACMLVASCGDRPEQPAHRQTSAADPAAQVGATADQPGVIPQARPVRDWLKSTQAGDLETFKSVFTPAIQEQFAQDGWETALARYKKQWADAFGDYRLEDFSFSYEGDRQAGKVAITYKQRKLPGLAVVDQGGVWKVNER